jgi:hypothetical protein
MRRPTKRQIAVPLVVLLVALAGCTGGGGGDGGDGTTLTATPTEDVDQDPSPTDTATESNDPSTATPTEETETTTREPTATATETSDPGTETPEAGGGGFSFDQHVSALQNTGGYTIEYTIQGLGTSSGSVQGTQKVDTNTGERYATLQTNASGQSYTIEYYSPPNSETLYQHVAGRTREATSSGGLIDLASLETSTNTDQAWLSNLRNAGTAETQLGPATKYVIDSVDQIPESSVSQYSSLESVELAIYVDKDTGLIARYDYRLTGTQNGEETTLIFDLRVTNLGSTTIDEPEWAP